MTNQTGYIVYATDSVGTALGEIEPGAIRLLGEPGDGHVTAAGHIPFGHKFALRAPAGRRSRDQIRRAHRHGHAGHRSRRACASA